MNANSSTIDEATRTSMPCIALLAAAMLVIGCSSSSDSQSPVNAGDVTIDEAIDNNIPTGSDDSNASGDDVANGDAENDSSSNATETGNNPTDSSDPESDISPPVNSDEIVPGRTRVDFEITVPAYQSNALQIRLVWGEMDVTARWIGDEFWSVSADFPADTEHPLTITFADNNGDIILGSYEQAYRTGVNDFELFEITADQFDTERWDSDEDGTSNLDELIAQTDPLVNEDSLLEVVDSISISTRMTISANFESRLSEERPFIESVRVLLPVPEEGPLSGFERNVDIAIDANGNGTFYDFYQQDRGSFFSLFEHTGNRTNTGTSVTWDGQWIFRDDALTGTTTSIDFSNTVTMVDETTRNVVESIFSNRSEFFFESTRIDSNLNGTVIDGSSLCRPDSGSVLITHRTNDTSDREVETNTTLISKEFDDTYWRVSVVLNDDEASRSEYFARALKALPYQFGVFENNDADFICNFVDW